LDSYIYLCKSNFHYRSEWKRSGLEGSNGKLLSAYILNNKITDVVVACNISANDWEVNLKLTGDFVTLYTKRNKLRTFSRLGSVADYLNEIGVSSFTVMQGSPRRVLWLENYGVKRF